MSENQILEGQPDRRAIPRLAPQHSVVLTVHDHQILPSYGVLKDISAPSQTTGGENRSSRAARQATGSSDGGASIFNDHLLETGRSVRLKLGLNKKGEPFETEARIVWSQNSLPIGALHGVEFTGLSEARREELRELLEQSESFGDDEHRASSRWRSAALVGVTLLLLVAAGTASIALQHIRVINERVESALSQVEQKTQQLSSGVRFDSKRQRLLLGIRDEIVRANHRIGISDAYQYAQFVLIASEKYPTIDPLLFLAVGIVESGYNPSATSHAAAAGLYQIAPTTGRMLARTLSWEYSPEMLYDPQKNTEMAALYLDILLSTHKDVEVVLAEYNGGPRNARYFRAGSSRLAEETRHYVPNVMNVYQRLKNRFEAEEHRAKLTRGVVPAGVSGTP